ncbi:FAD-binding protein [Streptomyces hygroscopicus]|uniref:FAD-binding oxidoreductase n=1 Tax=Streptomyces hygroscopicus TaxID=1912 RepID=UPI00223EE921|nr:FAD-binding oxidoreductase [Streptomyces hygroscopicus]MCW7942942.1 FAD-binding protein [Streptomyces hygroscopicus]
MAALSKAGAALAALRADLAGEVFAPGDPGYDEARTVFNARIDRRPAVVARCRGEPDVVRAVRFARDLDLKIAVRGGGHSVAGMAVNDNGVVVDLRRMRRVTVRPGSATVRVEGGALMSDLDRATRPHGLATTGGRISTAGVGGFVLGGGSGWLDRLFGPAVDNLLGVDLVTADGGILHASDGENSELFWALHGGGGNFGVATALTLRLHELSEFSVALILFPPERGPEAVRLHRDLIAGGPPQASGAVLRLTGLPEPFVPEYLVGRPLCGALVTYAGDADGLRGLVRPLPALPHESLALGAMPYAELQRMFDTPPGMRNHWSSEYLTGLPDELIDGLCARAMPAAMACRQMLFPLGGALGSGPPTYPVPHRDATWAVQPFARWEDPEDDERALRWAEDLHADVRPWRTGAVRVGLIGDEGRDRVVAGLGTGDLNRLARVKRRYDPDNVFRYNHNIPPA